MVIMGNIMRIKLNVFSMQISNKLKSMIIDAKKIVEKLKGESDRGSKNYYLLKSLTKEFEDVCKQDDVSASNVLEELIKVYLSSRKESTPKSIKPKKATKKKS